MLVYQRVSIIISPNGWFMIVLPTLDRLYSRITILYQCWLIITWYIYIYTWIFTILNPYIVVGKSCCYIVFKHWSSWHLKIPPLSVGPIVWAKAPCRCSSSVGHVPAELSTEVHPPKCIHLWYDIYIYICDIGFNTPHQNQMAHMLMNQPW